MFTGLVEITGRVAARRGSGSEADLDVDVGSLAATAKVGDSIALSGVCCTVVSLAGDLATFHLSAETLRRTWLGTVEPGVRLNLERALRVGDPLGGHLVQGHVDGLGRIEVPIDPREGDKLWLDVPNSLQRYCVEKGSIAVDGVSLTIAALDGPRVMIAVIPHTAQITSLGQLAAGTPVHLEVDVIAKYVERMLSSRGLGSASEWQPPT